MRLEQRKAEQAAERLAEAFQQKRLDEAQAGYARKAEAMKERQQRSEATLKEIGRAHVWTPVTRSSRMPSSAWKKKKKNNNNKQQQ